MYIIQAIIMDIEFIWVITKHVKSQFEAEIFYIRNMGQFLKLTDDI